MNIEADSEAYRSDFPNHIFTSVRESIDIEIKEAFDI